MLSRFSNEVLSNGPIAVLPQNLNGYWLKQLQKHSDDFLDNNFAIDECTETPDMGSPVLISCVHEAIQYNRGDGANVSAEELAENVTIYALSITMETIRREAKIELTLPTLDNLLSIDRIIQFGKINEDFCRFLERSCIIPEGEAAIQKSWFQQLKKNIRSRMIEN